MLDLSNNKFKISSFFTAISFNVFIFTNLNSLTVLSEKSVLVSVACAFYLVFLIFIHSNNKCRDVVYNIIY
jgi:hypothetical protein